MLWGRQQTVAAILCFLGFVGIGVLAEVLSPTRVSQSATLMIPSLKVTIDAPFYEATQPLPAEGWCALHEPKLLRKHTSVFGRTTHVYICGL